VREKAKQLIELLGDNERIRDERDKARRLRDKFVGIGATGGSTGISAGLGGVGGGARYGKRRGPIMTEGNCRGGCVEWSFAGFRSLGARSGDVGRSPLLEA
jgi:hypothetical protein